MAVTRNGPGDAGAAGPRGRVQQRAHVWLGGEQRDKIVGALLRSGRGWSGG